MEYKIPKEGYIPSINQEHEMNINNNELGDTAKSNKTN